MTDRELLERAALGVLVNRALFADGCRRLQEWSMIGHGPRVALESFAERLLAAEREMWQARVEEAFREGYWARETYNDSEVSDADEKWAKAKDDLLKPLRR